MVSPKSPSSPISVGRSSNNAGFRDLQEKAHLIHLALLEPKVDLWKLRALALSEGGLVNGMFATTPGRYVVLWRVSDCIGFVPSIALFASLTNISDALRQRAWPKLVGLHLFERDSTTGVMSTSTTSSVAMAGMAPSARASSSQSGRTMNQPSESSSDFHIDTTTMDNSRHQNNHNPQIIMVCLSNPLMSNKLSEMWLVVHGICLQGVNDPDEIKWHPRTKVKRWQPC